MIGRTVAAVHTDDQVVLDVVSQLATDAAKRAHGIDFFVDHLGADLGFGHQRAGRAGLHALAASHTRAVAHGVVQVKHDFTVRAAHGVAHHVIDLLFTAGAHAAVALDTSVKVHRHGGVRHVSLRLLPAQCLQRGAYRHAHARHPVAELAVLTHIGR